MKLNAILAHTSPKDEIMAAYSSVSSVVAICAATDSIPPEVPSGSGYVTSYEKLYAMGTYPPKKNLKEKVEKICYQRTRMLRFVMPLSLLVGRDAR
jgi:hypothetical protein